MHCGLPRGAPKSKLIIRGGVGLDSIDLEAARRAGIRVLNTPRASRHYDPHIGANSADNLLRNGEEVYNAVNQYQRERP